MSSWLICFQEPDKYIRQRLYAFSRSPTVVMVIDGDDEARLLLDGRSALNGGEEGADCARLNGIFAILDGTMLQNKFTCAFNMHKRCAKYL